MPQTCRRISLGIPKHLIDLNTNGTIFIQLIPGIPTHVSLKPYLSRPRCVPVGLILVCSSALDIMDEPMIQICCNSEILKGLTFNLVSFWRLIIYANVSHVCVKISTAHLFNIIFRFPSQNERGCCPLFEMSVYWNPVH